MTSGEIQSELMAASRSLARGVGRLRFGPPVTHVYNPLTYARRPHEDYLARYGSGPKRVVFVGMNPGPFGMAQTGVPFGAVELVRQWLGIEQPVSRPRTQHPKRPIEGFQCPRDEVSGRRLWGAVRDQFGTPRRFFSKHFVANYCPLLFMEESGRNRTPDKLPKAEREALFRVCDRHLQRLVDALGPSWVVGIGAFAEGRAREALDGRALHFGRIPHPSPANPAAQKDWAGKARRALEEQGVCR